MHKKFLLSCLFIFSCGQQKSGADLKVIYDEDNRRNPTSSDFADFLMQKSINATAAIVKSHYIEKSKDNYKIKVPGSLKKIKNVCSSERFADEPVFSACSAFLISSDVVVSAGHCFAIQSDCKDSKLVFGATLGELEDELVSESKYFLVSGF